MDKNQIFKIAENTLKGAAASAAVSVLAELTKDVKIGDRKIVLFTARDR